MNFKKISFLLLLLYSGTSLAQINHWETVISPNNSWSYLVPDAQPPITWTTIGFDDRNWLSGNSGIGYGDNDDATVIGQTISLYMRRQFNIISVDEIDAVLLDMDYDDSFIAYLNGIEIARALISGEPPAYNQLSDGDHEALLYRGIDPERFEVDKNLLIQGNNVLAIEVHNRDPNSSDMTSIPTLSLGITSANYNYFSVPVWFDDPFTTSDVTLESSNLPIVLIETSGGQEIPDEPKITAHMSIIDNGEGVRNFVVDASNASSLNYDGSIKIEVRGSSSKILPKKQYALTTYNEVGEKANISLLDLPVENDWILNGFAYDPSLMRDYISYQLSLQIGQYASRGVYCEVVLNGVYQGIYVLQEKLKADDNRIDIKKIGTTDNSGELLTGGYITKADKTEGADVAAWWMESYVEGYYTAFIHEHPKPTTVTSQQHFYIESQFQNLAATAGANNASLVSGYPSVIDLPSFVDFMLINEIASNADGYQFSTFFHKDRNGKLRAGPVWDFNLTYGNDLFIWGFDRSHTDIWQFDDGGNIGAKFWKDLFDDATFKCYLRKRWIELTQPGQPLHPDQINLLIDEVALNISEAVERENTHWGTIGDHSAHINEMKQWLFDRVGWISTELGSSQACSGEDVPELVISKINYHPMTSDGMGEKALEFIEITNIGDEEADLTGIYFGGTGLVYQFPANEKLSSGSSVYLANERMAFMEAYRFAPYDEFTRSLSNAGQRIQLLNGYGNLIDEVTYSDLLPWPTEADGGGYFLELIDPKSNNNDPSNWQASQFIQTSINSSVFDPVVEIYPNPTNNILTLRAETIIRQVKIWDLNGRLKLVKYPNKPEYQLSLEALEKAIYLINIETLSGSYNSKLFVSD